VREFKTIHDVDYVDLNRESVDGLVGEDLPK